MALFFTLSGFLITRFLAADHSDVRVFIVRRLFRIVPLSWVAMAIALAMANAPLQTWLANFLFYANLPPFWLVPAGSHLWSLCLEMQFYVAVALLVAVFGRRGLYSLPVACLLVTALRIASDTPISIVTWLRVDEILAGACVALAYSGLLGSYADKAIKRIPLYVLCPLLLLSAHEASGALNYVRPYLAALTVWRTLVYSPPMLKRVLEGRVASYIAAISYALYIVHGVLMGTWLGSGEGLVKYAKRPLLFAATFVLAHLSTFRFEQPCIRYAKKLSGRFSPGTSA